MTFIKSIILLFFLFTTTLIAANNTSLVHFNAEEEAFIKNNPIINVGAETDWPPFDFVENGKYTGFAKDYLDLIEQKSNLKFNYITDTWTNLLKKTKDQEIDLLPCLAKDENRETFLNFTDPYIITRDYLFAKESNTSINNIKDIDGKTVAIVKGYIHDKIIRKEHPLVKIYYTDSFLEAIDAVITNKADFIVANIALINYLTKKHSISNIGAKFHFAYRWNKLYMATNKKSTILRDIIQKSLNAISSDQKSKIEQKWISDKIEQNENTKSELNLTIQEEEYLYNKKTITIANELGWIPYDYFENDTAKGYVIDYMKLLCEKIGLEPIFLSNKWNILFNQFKKGEIDILPVVSYNKKRESFTNYTKSYLSQKLSIVTKMNNNSIINKDDLKNKKIGMVKDWNLTNFFRENYPNIRIIEFESLKDVFDALKNNFIEATVQNTLISK